MSLSSPYTSPNQNENNSRSPWSQGSQFDSSEGSGSRAGFDSLTLPPINPDLDNNFLPQLPSFVNNSDLFLPNLSSTNLRTAPQQEQPPPASNQQATHYRRPYSQYRLGESESPDPFDNGDLDDLLGFVEGLSPPRTPSPAQMPPSRPTTRRSSVVDLTSSSPPGAKIASTRKRKATEDAGQGRASKKAARTSKTGDGSSSSSRRQSLGDVQVVDLAEVEDKSQYQELAAKQQAELIKKQNEEESMRPVKLAEFQCVICMDNPTDLSVTHCGHLFCSECLHSAIHTGERKSCPICRTAISTTLSRGKQPKNGIFAMEMKLMTGKRKGKQAAT